MALLFLIDVALYSIVTWALLHSKGSIDKRKCCSLFNIMVYWPLGRWKLKELEIEIAKLKDFDKEYPVSALA